MVELHRLLDPTAPAITKADAIHVMRAPFNWLRHNDRDDEPQAADLDLQFEAEIVIDRAIENLFMLDGTIHKRAAEVVAAQRAHEQQQG